MRPLALIACAACIGAVLADEPCVEHECSNDRDGVLGDERLSWDASDGASYYEIKRSDDSEPCLAPVESTSVLVAGTPCVAPDMTAWLHVRACNNAGCSEWAGSVEFIPFACLRADGECEKPCYEGAMMRLEERYPTCPAHDAPRR
jgi:hypothetical protein